LLAEGFYQSNYDLGKLMATIFNSGWFYEEKNIGVHIKSPVELIVGIRRLIPIELEKPESQLLFQRVLGQILFYPPNVAGWPGGRNWIDSSALMFRMRIPQILTQAQAFLIKPKDDDDVMMGMEGVDKKPKANQLITTVDWNSVTKVFDKTSKENLLKNVNDIILQTKSTVNSNVLSRYIDKTSREAFIKTTIVELMSTPEYQLC
jgi:uncharacterized protein (DUF1800 family)